MKTPQIEKAEWDVEARRPQSTDETALSDASSSSGDSNYLAPVRTLPPQIPELGLTPQMSRGSELGLARRITTRGSAWTSDPAFEVDWEDEDPENPRNWPLWYKALIIFSISFSTLIVVFYSTSYTTGFAAMQEEFHIASETVPTLGVTTYLIGLAVGSLFLAPISETYGRKPVYAIAMFFFAIFIIPCARATSIAEIIVVRFFGAVAGSAMIANAPGTVGDIVGDEYRALAFSIWSIGPLNGPVLGPVIGGFITQYKGWRWTNWVVLILAGVAFIMMSLIKETYAPALLQKKAKKLRKEEDTDRYWSRYDQRLDFVELMKVNLSRPFSMAINEPICIFWNVYIAIIYGILYLCFVAYPIVFAEIRGWSISHAGLAFVGIGIGSMSVIFLEPAIRKMINSHKIDPETGHPPPEAAMSVVCIAACLTPIGQMWFAWTCVPKTIHWALPIAAGIPFGAGNTAVFIYASNYLVHSYGIYAASAMAGNSVIRSFLGGTLPLAGPALYRAMGPNWAGTFLGFLEVMIIPIPFVFYRYGAKIRLRSTLIRRMRDEEDRAARKRARAVREGRVKPKSTANDSAATETKEKAILEPTTDLEVEELAESQLYVVGGLGAQADARGSFSAKGVENKDFQV